MKINQNRMTYEDFHPKCRCIQQETQGQIVAFIQCFDDSTGGIRRYFGFFTHEDAEGSIRAIMKSGAKWPSAFRDIEL